MVHELCDTDREARVNFTSESLFAANYEVNSILHWRCKEFWTAVKNLLMGPFESMTNIVDFRLGFSNITVYLDFFKYYF